MPTPTINRSFQSSDLNRHSKEVFAAAEEQPVNVTRRDGEDLVLMSKREANSRDTLLEFAAQVIAAATDDRGTLAERMSKVFPWMLALDQSDRDQCARDLVDAARASFSTKQSHLAIAEMNAWMETASAIAAGLGTTQVEWLSGDDARPVKRP